MSLFPSRRRVLQGALLTLVSACTRRPQRPAPIDPDVALRAAAVARERALIAQYAGARPASPAVAAQLAAVAAEHAQHLIALGVTTASTGPSPFPVPASSLAELVAAERAAAAAHAADALRASRLLAAVLASLAASEASHPIALA